MGQYRFAVQENSNGIAVNFTIIVQADADGIAGDFQVFGINDLPAGKLRQQVPFIIIDGAIGNFCRSNGRVVGLPFTTGKAALTTTSSLCGIQNFLPTILLLSILSRFLVATSIVKANPHFGAGILVSINGQERSGHGAFNPGLPVMCPQNPSYISAPFVVELER